MERVGNLIECGGVVPLVRTAACHAGGGGFESLCSQIPHSQAQCLLLTVKTFEQPQIARSDASRAISLKRQNVSERRSSYEAQPFRDEYPELLTQSQVLKQYIATRTEHASRKSEKNTEDPKHWTQITP